MMGGYAFGFGGLMMLLFWVLVIALVVWLVLTVTRSQMPGGSHNATADTGMRILQERLARGEIDADEYRLRRTALEEGRR